MPDVAASTAGSTAGGAAKNAANKHFWPSGASSTGASPARAAAGADIIPCSGRTGEIIGGGIASPLPAKQLARLAGEAAGRRHCWCWPLFEAAAVLAGKDSEAGGLPIVGGVSPTLAMSAIMLGSCHASERTILVAAMPLTSVLALWKLVLSKHVICAVVKRLRALKTASSSPSS